MSRTTVVDAHALLWFLEGNEKLSMQGRQRMSDPEARLLIPAIALAEAYWAIGKGHTTLTINELRHAVSTDRRFQVIPLDGELVFAAVGLPGDLEMYDRIIAATTARERAADPSVALLTCDEPMRAAGVVPTVW